MPVRWSARPRLFAPKASTLRQNQVSINLLDRSIEQNGVLEAARELGITLIAYAPLRAGFLTGRFHDDPQALRRTHWLRRQHGQSLPGVPANCGEQIGRRTLSADTTSSSLTSQGDGRGEGDHCVAPLA